MVLTVCLGEKNVWAYQPIEGGPTAPSTTSSSPCSLPDHPISQLLKKLQCAVYSALYPIVSRAAISATPAPGCCSLPPEANGLLAPGSRRLRSSQSLYCMLSPSELSTAPRPLDGPPSIPSIPTLHSGPLDREADSSPAGPSSPLVDASSHLPDKDSSFEDLEQFLAVSEPQTPGAKREPLLECLKSTVKDIHNAIGEPAGPSQELFPLHLPALKCNLLPWTAKTSVYSPAGASIHSEEQDLAYPSPSDHGWSWHGSSGIWCQAQPFSTR